MTKEQLQDKCRGCLVGGAIGDALGYPVEFVYSFEEIRRKYGDDGITEYDMCYPWLEEGIRHYKALFSDDTQMTLYTAEGCLKPKTAENKYSSLSPMPMPFCLEARSARKSRFRMTPSYRKLMS